MARGKEMIDSTFDACLKKWELVGREAKVRLRDRMYWVVGVRGREGACVQSIWLGG